MTSQMEAYPPFANPSNEFTGPISDIHVFFITSLNRETAVGGAESGTSVIEKCRTAALL